MSAEANYGGPLETVLNLGSFPKDVLDFQELQDLTRQTIFLDYQLHLLLQREFDGLLFSRITTSTSESLTERVDQLIDYAKSIGANYSSTNRSYDEGLYHAVLSAHLYHLANDLNAMKETLLLFSLKSVDTPLSFYLTARYNALLGFVAPDTWYDYLKSFVKYGCKSLVAANRWIDGIFANVLFHLSKQGKYPLSFKHMLEQEFADNVTALVSILNFALRSDYERFILKSYRADYIVFLTELLNSKIKNRGKFPDASSENFGELNFVDSLYETLNDISDHRPVVNYFLKPKLSKKYLIAVAELSFQNQTVVANLIRSLLDSDEYDEALAAFKTYINYVKKDQEQEGGVIANILEVIDIYSTCIAAFNPLSSVILQTKSGVKRFKYNSIAVVMEELELRVVELLLYLDDFTDMAKLSYDEELEAFSENRLLFLYHRYNTNLVMEDKAKLIRVLSKGWFALGQYHQYKATYESADSTLLDGHRSSVLKYNKNCLIINPTGNPKYLFQYALTLAYSQLHEPALKLCKFILKRYPESFKSWNLLALLSLALEPETTKAADGESDHVLDELKENTKADSEKYIDDALNVAGIFIMKNKQQDVTLSVQTRYDILQLKMTQVAILESHYGVHHILDSITDVFSLYRELFSDIDIASSGAKPQTHRNDSRWSHRPSVIDIKGPDVGRQMSILKEKSAAKEKIKRLSKGDGLVRTTSKISKSVNPKPSPGKQLLELLILQELWLWTASIYSRLGMLDEAEECVVEAESAYEPNVRTFTFLGLLTSETRKFLSLQEFERSLEALHSPQEAYNRSAYGQVLLGMCKLFLVDDDIGNSLFISQKDMHAGLMRLKNYLQGYSLCWPHGNNSPEVWHYLAMIYEKFDDKLLYTKAMWRCVALASKRPVRSFANCEGI